MSPPINRVIYAGACVLISDTPACQNLDEDFSLKLIDKIQDSSIQITYPISRKKHIGYDEFLYDNYITPPEITCEISYINQNNSNELVLGLNATGENIYKNEQIDGAERNLFFLFDVNNSELDIFNLENYTGIQVFSLGNVCITNYSTSARVGELPKSSVSFVASNVCYDVYDGNQIIPSLNSSGQVTEFIYKINPSNFKRPDYISNSGDDLVFLKSGDIILELGNPTDNIGGSKFITNGKIQDYTINIPFERRDLVGFGSDYPYKRKLFSPSIGNLSMSVIFDGFNTGNHTGVIFQNKTNDFKIRLFDCNGVEKLNFFIEKAKITSQTKNLQIGDSFVFDGSFEFPIGENYGFKINGISNFI